MKNILIINNGIVDLLSCSNNNSNTFYINNNLIDQSLWVGDGDYIYTDSGVDFTITKVSAINAGDNVMLQKIDDTHYIFVTIEASGNIVTGVKGSNESSYRTGNVNITKDNIGLGNVDNTADANKLVAYAAVSDRATRADIATYANNDSLGNNISDTYAKKRDFMTRTYHSGIMSFTAGGLGVQGAQTSVDIRVTGYTPIVVSISYCEDSSKYIPLVMFGSSNALVYVNLYRATTSAFTSAGDAVNFIVAYVKD